MKLPRWNRASVIAMTLTILCLGCTPVAQPPPPAVVDESRIVAPEQRPASQQRLMVPGPYVVPAPPTMDSLLAQTDMTEMRAIHALLTDEQRTRAREWNAQPVVRWNAVARDLVAASQYDPLEASRIYMLLSVAQQRAISSALEAQTQYRVQLPVDPQVTRLFATDAVSSYPSEHAALAAASVQILSRFFPGATGQLAAMQQEAQDSRIWAGVNCRTDLVVGASIGVNSADQLIAQSTNELASVPAWDNVIPVGDGMWVIDTLDPQMPANPSWRSMPIMLIDRPDQFRLPPPPAYGSPAFQEALAEVRQIADTRTEEQIRIAKFWNDGIGTYTPPGHWNAIAADLILKQNMSIAQAARTFAYMNMAMYDAGIAGWDSKYAYWLIRPWNADTNIKTVSKRHPNHPSYPSGHSVFSGAASAFLAGVFPDHRASLLDMAKEASLSRLYNGIHYRFDCEQGLVLGEAIGTIAFDAWQR